MAGEAELPFAAAASLRALCMARGDGESHAACTRARVSSRAADGDAERVQEHVAGHRAAFLAEGGPKDVLELAEEQVLLGIEDIVQSSGADRNVGTMGKDYDEFAGQGPPIAAARYAQSQAPAARLRGARGGWDAAEGSGRDGEKRPSSIISRQWRQPRTNKPWLPPVRKNDSFGPFFVLGTRLLQFWGDVGLGGWFWRIFAPISDLRRKAPFLPPPLHLPLDLSPSLCSGTAYHSRHAQIHAWPQDGTVLRTLLGLLPPRQRGGSGSCKSVRRPRISSLPLETRTMARSKLGRLVSAGARTRVTLI